MAENVPQRRARSARTNRFRLLLVAYISNNKSPAQTTVYYGPVGLFVSLLIVNGLLAMTALGWVVWITTSPRHWFADAYAAQGPRGKKGPRGEHGPIGPAGPVGPDAEDAIASLESDLSDVADRVEMLETETGTSDLESDVEDAKQSLENLCDALSYYTEGALSDVYSAVVEYIGWYNAARLHESLGDIPPIEYEQEHASRGPTTLAGATA